MQLNHLNLVVSDVAGAAAFFETYFGFSCTEIKGDHAIANLKGEGGFSLVIMRSKDGGPVYPDAFHVGFMLDSEEAVMTTFQILKHGGIHVEREPAKIRDSFGFYFRFEGLMIEVGHYTA